MRKVKNKNRATDFFSYNKLWQHILKNMNKPISTDVNLLKTPTFVSPINENSIRIAQDLADTLMYNWAQGRVSCSLSANQIGERESIIVVCEKIGGNIITMFNPQIKEKREEMDYWEDNMCRPQMLFKNQRAYEVLVGFQDARGYSQRAWFSGKLAGIIQQEIDNLNGILPEERALVCMECGERPKKQSIMQR